MPAFCQRTPGFKSYIVRLQVFQHLPLLIENMGLALVHDRYHLCIIHNLRKGVWIEV